jgi:hypothetical protein
MSTGSDVADCACQYLPMTMEHLFQALHETVRAMLIQRIQQLALEALRFADSSQTEGIPPF